MPPNRQVSDDDESWAPDEDADDRDLPQERDLDDDDALDETPTAPCPKCGAEIADIADRCPVCGENVVPGSGERGRQPPWLAAIVLIVVLGFVAWLLRAL